MSDRLKLISVQIVDHALDERCLMSEAENMEPPWLRVSATLAMPGTPLFSFFGTSDLTEEELAAADLSGHILVYAGRTESMNDAKGYVDNAAWNGEAVVGDLYIDAETFPSLARGITNSLFRHVATQWLDIPAEPLAPPPQDFFWSGKLEW